jgi:hypothetical protein
MRADDGDDRRAALIARKEEALKRWPSRAGPDFQAELSAIADELSALARSLDEAHAEAIDRLRAWCAVGEAFMLLGQTRALQAASEAFRTAEALTSIVDAQAHELMKLKHGYGWTLLELAAGANAELAAEAAARLSSALSLARKHMPVGVASIKYELFRAEHTVAQLKLKGAQLPPRRDAPARPEVEAA